jgi:hypothetical protein
MAAQGLRVLRGIDREHLLQQISGRPVGHDGGEMRLKPVEFRWSTGNAVARRSQSLSRHTPHSESGEAAL